MRLAPVRLLALALLAGCGSPPNAHDVRREEPAPARIALVESVPLETTLGHADVADASDVWLALIDGAKTSIDLEQLYASEAEGKDLATSKLAPIVAALERAVARGVKVRFLADAMFAKTYPATLERLHVAGAQVRRFDVAATMGGVQHAKYFVVDGKRSFIGSQNFDWRALAHIFEMGVSIESPDVGRVLEDLFQRDWHAAGQEALPPPHAWPDSGDAKTSAGESVLVVESPQGYLPDTARWDLPRLVAMIDAAKTSVAVQVLTYKTTSRDGSPFPTLDDAVRRAAARGVHVRLLVSHWGAKPGSDGLAALKAIASVPNVEVRVLTVPPFSGGDIPFARVAHAKYMIVDGAQAWVGSSNWEGDYFTRSRNVGVIVSGGLLPARLARVFDDGFGSAYATALTPEASRSGSASPPSGSGPAPR